MVNRANSRLCILPQLKAKKVFSEDQESNKWDEAAGEKWKEPELPTERLNSFLNAWSPQGRGLCTERVKTF